MYTTMGYQCLKFLNVEALDARERFDSVVPMRERPVPRLRSTKKKQGDWLTSSIFEGCKHETNDYQPFILSPSRARDKCAKSIIENSSPPLGLPLDPVAS